LIERQRPYKVELQTAAKVGAESDCRSVRYMIKDEHRETFLDCLSILA
jgi:hypothetical protein